MRYNGCADRSKNKAIIISCIDNLIKGGSGQAVQNMNIAFNFKDYRFKMKYLYFLLFFFLFSCFEMKKSFIEGEYICKTKRKEISILEKI